MKSMIFACFSLLCLAETAMAQTAPLIDHLSINDPTGTLTIFGSFGLLPGTIEIDSVFTPYSSWSSDSIVCVIPDTGKGSCGPVQVSTSAGTSGQRLLSAWYIDFSDEFGSPYFYGGVSEKVLFRLDLITALQLEPFDDTSESGTTYITYRGPGNGTLTSADTTVHSRWIGLHLYIKSIDLGFQFENGQAGSGQYEAEATLDSRFNIVNDIRNLGPHENLSIYGYAYFIPPDSELSNSEVANTIGLNALHASIFPLPATHIISISYNLPEVQPVKISIVNVAGVNIRQILNGSLQAEGQHIVPIDISGLPPGTYFAEIQTEKYFDVVKLQVQCS